MKKLKGLFLGAGASYECGMPLVWEFTNVFRNQILKRLDTKLFNLGKNSELKKYFIDLLNNKDLHYEQIVEDLQNLSLKMNKNEEIEGLIDQVIECIQLLFLEYHEKTLSLLNFKVADYIPLKKLVSQEKPLYIFSLNHDLIIEELSNIYNIKLKDGFWEKESHNYKHLGKIKFITKDQFSNGDLNFFDPGQNGINLIKLHGSLDIFAVEDKKLFTKIDTEEKKIGAFINAIKNLEKITIEICKEDGGFRPINELLVKDNKNEIQFFRRSLLTGGYKFTDKFEQIAPKELFIEFEKRINYLSCLNVIGYSFGDKHVNGVIIEWLKSSSNNELYIYDPYRNEVPKSFENFSNQIKIENKGLTQYLLDIDSSHDCDDLRKLRKELEIKRDDLKKRRLDQFV